MRRLIFPASLLLSACATTNEVPPELQAIEDFIAVSELPEVTRIRTDRRETYEELDTNRYVIFKTRRQYYLIEFRRNCWELREDFSTVNAQSMIDRRVDDNNFYPRSDTIRGCPTGRAYQLNEGQVEELRNLGDAPSGG